MLSVGAANVAQECIRYEVPRYIVVSAAACSSAPTPICESKVQGEKAVRDLYAAARNPKITYTIARTGVNP